MRGGEGMGGKGRRENREEEKMGEERCGEERRGEEGWGGEMRREGESYKIEKKDFEGRVTPEKSVIFLTSTSVTSDYIYRQSATVVRKFYRQVLSIKILE